MNCVGHGCSGCPSNTHTNMHTNNPPTKALHLRHGIHARINAVMPPDGDVPLEAHSRPAINDWHACLRPTFYRVGEFAAHAQLSRQTQERGYDAPPDVRIVAFVRCDR